MSTYNPGPGWRVADQQDDVRDCIAYWDAETRTWNHWVREAPVLPLPTAPYTIIRVTWKQPGNEDPEPVLTRAHTAAWFGLDGAMYTTELAGMITSFEVLSEPRSVTAKHIVRYMQDNGFEQTAKDVAREFGVES